MRGAAEFSGRVWYAVDEIKDIHEDSGSFETLFAWKGLTTSGDSWKLYAIMYEDVPTKAGDSSNAALQHLLFVEPRRFSDSNQTMGDFHAP